MGRRKIPSDTYTFHYHNQNPHNRSTTDCVIRALSLAANVPYNQVVMDLAVIQCETGYDDGEARVYGKWLENHGFEKCKQPRRDNGDKYTGEDFCTWLSVNERKEYGNIVAHIGGHHIVAIVPTCKGNGSNDRFKVCDTWNSTRYCIGNYWRKKDGKRRYNDI